MKESIVDEIMRQLSKKKDATIHLDCNDDNLFSCTNDYFLVLFKISMKYGIKITMDEITLLLLKKLDISNILKYLNYPIEQCVTHCIGKIDILNYKTNDCIRKMRCYENLKKITLMFKYISRDYFLNKDDFEIIISLKNHKKVEEFELIVFTRPCKGINKTIEILHKNIKCLIQLIRNSVKKLLLCGIPKLNHDITRTIERYMPNIEVLSLDDISFEERNCLSLFKKLKVVTISTFFPIEIPDNVNLFIIYTNQSTKNDTDQELIEEYSKKFSKRLVVGNIKNIFLTTSIILNIIDI
uniref:RNA methyltransferase n=1 Tax=Strongyloides venezuelensis TaxID=75913 RepID=A0A0K0EYX7_STRVS